jgi:hypothetical protein
MFKQGTPLFRYVTIIPTKVNIVYFVYSKLSHL